MITHADVVGRIDGGRAESIVVTHPALGEHPDLPVRGKTLKLSVPANVYRNTQIVKIFGRGSALEMADFILLVWNHGSVARPRVHNSAWCEREQPLFLPYVGVLVPVVLAAHASVVNG